MGSRPIAAVLLLIPVTTACVALIRTDPFRGACEKEERACETRCEELVAGTSRDRCTLACDGEASLCSSQHGDPGTGTLGMDVSRRRMVTDLTAPARQRVELRNGRIESTGVSASISGPAQSVEGAYELLPGAALKVAFELPPTVREAELQIEHASASGHGFCFVTISIGDVPIAARYQPPGRKPDGQLRIDTWDLTTSLPAPTPGPTQFTLFIYNNAVAGSVSPYLVGRIELVSRARKP